MRGISKSRILSFIEQDVRTVKEEALGVFRIDSDSQKIEFIENKNPRLGVLAILGSGEGFGRKFEEVLLVEIGVSRTRPYHEARGLARKEHESNVPQRRKWFDLTQDQYKRVAPFVFKQIQLLTDKRVGLWKCGVDNPFCVKTSRHYWMRSKKKLFISEAYKPQVQGARFSISLKDKFFLKQVYQAELSMFWKKRLEGLAKFIDLRLSSYRSNGYRRNFLTLQGVRQILDILEYKKLPAYALEEMVNTYLPEGRKNRLFNEIVSLVGWNGDKSEERRLAEEAIAMAPLPKLKVTSGINGSDFIVFEVFPSSKV